MKRLVITGIVLVILVATGILGLLYLSRPQISALKADLDEVVTEKKDILRSMQVLFDSHPHLLAAFVLNPDKTISGSLFESSRIHEGEYTRIKKDVSLGYPALSKKLTERGKILLQYKQPKISGEILLVLTQKMEVTDTLQALQLKSQSVFILILAVFSILFLGAIVLFILSLKSMPGKHLPHHLQQNSQQIESSAPVNLQPVTELPTTKSSERPKDSNLIPLENSLSLFLGDLVSQPRIKTATLYRYKHGKPGIAGDWLPRLQRHGAITITGNSLKDSELPVEEDLTDGLPVLDNKGSKLFIPLLNNESLWGGILLTAKDDSTIDPSMARDITAEVRRFSRNLYEHENFSAAVFDAETGFRSSPLFPIYLKERMLSPNEFHLAVFELRDLESRSPESLHNWAQSLAAWMNARKLASENVFRLNLDRFVIFFNKEEEQKEIMYTLKRLSMTLLGIDPIGAVLPGNSELEGTENFMRRLEKAIRIARREGSIRTHENQWHSTVA